SGIQRISKPSGGASLFLSQRSDGFIITSSPTDNELTFLPTDSITPAPSEPSTSGDLLFPIRFSILKSRLFNPATLNDINTSFAPTSSIGVLLNLYLPDSVMLAVIMIHPFLVNTN